MPLAMSDLATALRALIEDLYPEATADGIPAAGHTTTTATVQLAPFAICRAVVAKKNGGASGVVVDMPTELDVLTILETNLGATVDAGHDTWLDDLSTVMSAGSRAEAKRRVVELVKLMMEGRT